MDAVIVLTTLPLDLDADQFARALIDERLAACVNVFPAMRSTYSWNGAVEVTDERQVLIKTTRLRLEELRARLHDLHPYELPEFLVIEPAEGSPDYLAWLAKRTDK
jgi:periplasmic divalent cation tolerance protein